MPIKMSLVSRNAGADQHSTQEIKILVYAFTTTWMQKLCILYHCKVYGCLILLTTTSILEINIKIVVGNEGH